MSQFTGFLIGKVLDQIKVLEMNDERFYEGVYWLERVEGKTFRIGIKKDKAEKSGSRFVFIKLPEEGESISEGEKLMTLETSKTTYELESPVTGKVTKINKDLSRNPERIKESPEETWIVEMEVEESFGK